MVQLAGKVALITGASKGVGRVMSRMFAAEGAAVICAARSRDLVQETAALVKRDGGRAIAAIGDAAVEADVLRMVEPGVKACGKLDTLVNNAGDGGPTKPVQDYTAEDWFYTINSCLTSSYMCTRFVVPEMLKVGGGAIVNISSVAGGGSPTALAIARPRPGRSARRTGWRSSWRLTTSGRRGEEPLRPVHRGDGRGASALSATRPCGDPDCPRPSRRTGR